jgi:uncharacterized SAM-binding protein YcdF (DUF218 family)
LKALLLLIGLFKLYQLNLFPFRLVKFATQCNVQKQGENLYYAQQIAWQNGLTRIFIVSDPLHLKRAVLIAQDLGMDAYPAPTPTTRYQSLSSQLSFLVRETYYYTAYLIQRPFMG